MTTLAATLSDVFFLRHADLSVRLEFERLAVCHTYPKGNILFHHGDPGTSVYVVVDGRVKISLINDDGREVILALIRPGGVFGLVAALDSGTHIGTAITITDCRIAAVLTDRFSTWLRQHPPLHESITAELTQLLRAAYEKIGEQALLPVKKRLLATLVEIARAEGLSDKGEIVFLRPTQQELAERVGSTRVVVARALKELLEEEAAIAGEGRTVRLSARALVPPEEFYRT